MNIIDALLGEHAVLYALFHRMDEVVPNASAEAVRPLAGLLDAALRSHARIEDELLFLPLEPHLGTGGGPRAVMRAEHDEIEKALDRAIAPDNAAPGGDLLHAVRCARSHFTKEEQILYPLARRALGVEKLEDAGRKWAARRGVALIDTPGCCGV